MSAAIVRNNLNYKEKGINYVLNTPLQKNIKDKLPDNSKQLVLYEKDTYTSNDSYRNAFIAQNYSYTSKSYFESAVDMTSIINNTNKNSCFKGTLNKNSDVDYFSFSTMIQRVAGKPITITMKMPEGSDYDLTLYDGDGNQVGIATTNEDGTKSVVVPTTWLPSTNYVMKIENAEGSIANGEESYTLTFEQGEMSRGQKDVSVQEKEENIQQERNEYEQKLQEFHDKQKDALPKELQYQGEETPAELIERKLSGEELSDAEKMYVQIYAKAEEIQKIQDQERRDQLRDTFDEAIKEAGISETENMQIQIASNGSVAVTGLSEENNKKAEALIKKQFTEDLYNAYIENSQKVSEMTRAEYQNACYVEELDRFLAKISGGTIDTDDLSFKSSENELSKEIEGMPDNIAQLINQADGMSNYYDYKNMMQSVIQYRNQSGKLPKFDVMITWNGSKFVFE